MGRLDEKVVLITGAGAGIERSAAHLFAIARGYEDCIDIDVPRFDPAFKLAGVQAGRRTPVRDRR